MVTGSTADADLDWCHGAVEGVSRTFALTVDALEEPMSTNICLGYLLCRVADTVEDAGHIPPEPRAELLRAYDTALDPATDRTMTDFRDDVDEWLPEAGERSDDWAVVARAPTIWATVTDRPESVQGAIVPLVREMVDGMAMFVERHASTDGLRIEDRTELERYCYYAAGTVGTLITNLLTRGDVSERRSHTLYDTAEEFGLLLQLVNVSKDVYTDFTDENNVYLPAEWLAAEGVEQDAILDPDNRAGAARVVERTAAHASTFLDDAQAYIEAMPLTNGNTLAAWLVPYLLSVGTLRELDDRPADALTESGVKISRAEVLAVMDAATGADRDAVGELREAVASEPFHETIG